MEEKKIIPEVLLYKAIGASLPLSESKFPTSIFPMKIQRIIKEVHECQNFPIDYVGASMLVAIALGIGNTHLAQLKNGWQESPILYMAFVGRTGTNKSHPLSLCHEALLGL